MTSQGAGRASALGVLVRNRRNSDRAPIGTHHAIEQSKTARRCRSLETGARAWAAEVRYRGGARRGAVLLTLTFREKLPDEQVAYQVRRFWDSYCKHFKYRPQRLSWLEYQRSGRHHYHAIIIDPPPVALHRWETIRALWGQGRTNLLWRNAEWVDRKALGYAVGYSKKFGEKAYQQQYEGATRAIRTFACNRLRSADSRVERLPRWATRAGASVGRQIVDGGRAVGGGVAVEWCSTAGGQVGPIERARLRIEHRIEWDQRRYWPPGCVVVTLGAVSWDDETTGPQVCRNLTGVVHSAAKRSRVESGPQYQPKPIQRGLPFPEAPPTA